MKRAIYFLILFACQRGFTQEQLHIDTNRIKIFSYDSVLAGLPQDAKATSLANNDLDLAESILIACIDSSNATHSSTEKFDRRITLNQYNRQYVPFLDRDGRKYVWINFLCTYHMNDFRLEWKKNIVIADGGGACFFQILINLSEKYYYDFFINAPM